MSDQPARHPITLKRIIRDLESMKQVEVTRDVTYYEDLKLDIYHPDRSSPALPPAVMIVAGYRERPPAEPDAWVLAGAIAAIREEPW